MKDNGMTLVAPKVTPPLDPFFRPAVLANRMFRSEVNSAAGKAPVILAVEQADGSIFHFSYEVLPNNQTRASANFTYL